MSLFTNKQMIGLGVAAVAAFLLLKKQAKETAGLIDPTSEANLFYQSAEGITEAIAGEGALNTVGDYFFGGLDLINPWAPESRKAYAQKVYGL